MDGGGGCIGDACGTTCPDPVAPAACPEARVTGSVDLRTGCPILVCGPCPQVDIPACEQGTHRAERDTLTECPIAWICDACVTPEPPVCEDGYPVADVDPASGCTSGWSCTACPVVDPPDCAGASQELDPVTGCIAAWNCPGCPIVERPECEHGPAIPETDELGCTTWSCPVCPQVDEPSCPGAIEQIDPATGCTTGWRCPGGDMWGSVDGLTGAALEAALRDLVDGHHALSYNGARDVIFTSLDVVNGMIECIYTGRLVAEDGSRTPGGFNTEHSWPQSQGADSTPARSDMHHLFPTDSGANSRRSSLDFGDTACTGSSCTWAVGGSELGPPPGGGTNVFEVRTKYRGDIARAHFYFAVRYGRDIGPSEEAVLRRWHAEDPPSQRERNRNDGIEAIQNNRNPFVDRPEFVDLIQSF